MLRGTPGACAPAQQHSSPPCCLSWGSRRAPRSSPGSAKRSVQLSTLSRSVPVPGPGWAGQLAGRARTAVGVAAGSRQQERLSLRAWGLLRLLWLALAAVPGPLHPVFL